MSSYRNHIKKIGLTTSGSLVSKSNVLGTVFLDKKTVLKKKNVKKILPELSDIEKDQITKVDDFHEFIEGSKLDDDSEE